MNKGRRKEILDTITSSKFPISAEVLSQYLGIPKYSIKHYIDKLIEEDKVLKTTTSSGTERYAVRES